MLPLLAFVASAEAQNSAVGKTLVLIPNDEAWGDVVQKTQPCSVPGEASCAQFKTQDKSLTPLESFSQGSSGTALINQNDPSTLAQALTPALTSLTKGKISSIQTPKTAFHAVLKNPPMIRGGNGTFTTLPNGVQRMNQTTKKTLNSLSKDNRQ